MCMYFYSIIVILSSILTITKEFYMSALDVYFIDTKNFN